MEDEVYVKDRPTWRKWLEKNHDNRQSVWMIIYKKDSGKGSVPYDDAVEEALCFGWVDSKVQSLDDERYRQYYSVRKPNSNWSGSNKKRVAKLIKAGLMTEAGLAAVEVAKANGSWEFLDDIEAMVVPDDLAKALAGRKGARRYFDKCSPSARQGMLMWVKSAKREETRAKRIGEIAGAAAKGELPLPYL
ncbi:MAG: YdeI/OmpD-associated family protein [Acidimicrobiia bacterium]|nr:YdeI/OmpD-associated family protein [Acidimicrobiia bacterium]MDH3470036.1 YdeI/OmpD-associated family protein [Acidimicrobiia bacterium]